MRGVSKGLFGSVVLLWAVITVGVMAQAPAAPAGPAAVPAEAKKM